jgi:chromosomal replication initiation ATPase DnaA
MDNTIEEIKKTACIVNHITMDQLESKSRLRSVVEARRMVFNVARDLLEMTFSETGKIFNQDHATAIHHIKQNRALISVDSFYRKRYEYFINLIKSNLDLSTTKELLDEINYLKAENLRIETELIQKNNE